MKLEGVSFPDAVRELGRKAGVEIPIVQRPGDAQAASTRDRVHQANAAAAVWFQQNLSDSLLGVTARRYLADRGITAETVESFRLGLAVAGWDGLLRHLAGLGYSPAELAAAGLAVPKDAETGKIGRLSGYYDRFRARLMFPICDLSGKVVGFGGRVLDDGTPKYLNSSETPVFSKGRTLYALNRARDAAARARTLILVEGYFDAIALHQAGIAHVAATMGTALTAEHVQMIRRFVSQVVLLFDPDAAGVNAALRTMDLLTNSGLDVRVVSLPAGDDPDMFVRQRGADAFRSLEAGAPSLLEFAVEHSLKAAASGRVQDKVRSVDEVLRTLKKTANRVEREECLRRVADRLGVSESLLIERYKELAPAPSPGGHASGHRAPGGAGVQSSRVKLSAEEGDLVYLLLHGHLGPREVELLNPEWLPTPACRRIVELALGHLDADGRILLRPLLDEAMADATCEAVAVELSMADRHFDDVVGHVRGCLDRLRRRQLEASLAELIVKLRVAEREGRADEARKLNAQVNELRLNKIGLASVRAE
jgi:DNA primase